MAVKARINSSQTVLEGEAEPKIVPDNSAMLREDVYREPLYINFESTSHGNPRIEIAEKKEILSRLRSSSLVRCVREKGVRAGD